MRQKHEDSGFVIFIVLVLISIISGLAYYYYYPYRELATDYIHYESLDGGLAAAFSIEDIVSKLLPRVNIPLYQRIRGYESSTPLKWSFPYSNGDVTIKLESLNNCINVTTENPSSSTEMNALSTILSRLSQNIPHKNHVPVSVVRFLETSLSSAKYSNALTTITERDHRELALLIPYLCRTKKTGQKININAITDTLLPVLDTVLAKSISPKLLSMYWKNHKTHYWKSKDDFYSDLNLNLDARNAADDVIITEDQEVMLTMEYITTDGNNFYIESHFILQDGKAVLLSRRLYNDGSIR